MIGNLLGSGANIAFGIGGAGGAITGTALAGAGAITDGVMASKAQKAAESKAKKEQTAQLIGGLLQQIAAIAQGAAGAGGAGGAGDPRASIEQIQKLGQQQPEALKSALQDNPEAAQALIASLGGGSSGGMGG